MVTIKPNNPPEFDGSRDALKVNAWLYQVDVYINLVQLSNLENQFADQIKISFESTLMKDDAANWWFMFLKSVQAPGALNGFQNFMQRDFILQDSVLQSREKLRELKKKTSVTTFLIYF